MAAQVWMGYFVYTTFRFILHFAKLQSGDEKRLESGYKMG
jgi:hypothetical protein